MNEIDIAKEKTYISARPRSRYVRRPTDSGTVADAYVARVNVFSDVLSDVRASSPRASRRDAAEVSGYAVGAIFFQYQLRENSVAYGAASGRHGIFDRRCRARLSVSAGRE